MNTSHLPIKGNHSPLPLDTQKNLLEKYSSTTTWSSLFEDLSEKDYFIKRKKGESHANFDAHNMSKIKFTYLYLLEKELAKINTQKERNYKIYRPIIRANNEDITIFEKLPWLQKIFEADINNKKKRCLNKDIYTDEQIDIIENWFFELHTDILDSYQVIKTTNTKYKTEIDVFSNDYNIRFYKFDENNIPIYVINDCIFIHK